MAATSKARKPPKGKDESLCVIPHCRKKRAKGKRICYAHNLAIWRKNNPKRAAFHKLKSCANRRHIPFTLEYSEFLQIIEGTDYGEPQSDLHIDRREAHLGYTFENCRVLDGLQNIIKGNKERWTKVYREALADREGSSLWKRKKIVEGYDPDLLPF